MPEHARGHRKVKVCIAVSIILFVVTGCAPSSRNVSDVTTDYLKKSKVQIGFCEYQGPDRATGERKVLYLKKPAEAPIRLILEFSNGRLLGDVQSTIQRFEISDLPVVYIQSWEWESYTSGDLGLRRPKNIEVRRLRESLLKSIYSMGDYP